MKDKKNTDIDKKKLKIPEHIAIIMDGNGRWASSKGLARTEGHRAGAKSVRRVIDTCIELNVKYLTLYAFSWENWQRPQSEINFLMELLNKFITNNINKMLKNNGRLLCIGRLEKLPINIQQKLKESAEKSKNNTGLTVFLAISYGGREEIVDAAKKLALDVKKDKIKVDKIDNNIFQNYLYTKKYPDPDLLIRTSGEMRISNFLLWQISYSEIIILEKMWPEFNKDDMIKAINIFSQRQRRFGAI